MITHNYYKLIRCSFEDTEYLRMKNVSDSVGQFSVNATSSESNIYTLEYSFDTTNWTSYDLAAKPSIDVNPGTNIYLRGTAGSYISTFGNDYRTLNMNVQHTVGGNILSIYDKNNFTTLTEVSIAYGFQSTFLNDTQLISAKDLNFGHLVTISGNNAFRYFFKGCTSLVYGCNLSNIETNSNLKEFYNGCTSLIEAYTPNVSSWSTSGMSNWLQNVAASGTLYCPSQAVADLIPNNNVSGCPSGWTKQVIS